MVPNHLTPTYASSPPRIAGTTGRYDASQYVPYPSTCGRNTLQHIANETKILAKASERFVTPDKLLHPSVSRNRRVRVLLI